MMPLDNKYLLRKTTLAIASRKTYAQKLQNLRLWMEK